MPLSVCSVLGGLQSVLPFAIRNLLRECNRQYAANNRQEKKQTQTCTDCINLWAWISFFLVAIWVLVSFFLLTIFVFVFPSSVSEFRLSFAFTCKSCANLTAVFCLISRLFLSFFVILFHTNCNNTTGTTPCHILLRYARQTLLKSSLLVCLSFSFNFS